MSLLRIPAAARKPDFANRASGFVNRAAKLPGFRALALGSLAAIVLAVLVGAFGTGEMPLSTRLLFWTGLIGTNAMLWQAWFAITVRGPKDWNRSALIGAVLINAPLPFEISLFLSAVGVDQPADWPSSWVKALAISAVLVVLTLALRQRTAPPAARAAVRPGGLLAKAGLADPAQLLAIRAEDHYCRAFLDGGRAVLVHHRFADALAEVADLNGAQIHRGAWIADRGVHRAMRSGRSWRLELADGTALPVSAAHLATVRARGWLNRRL